MLRQGQAPNAPTPRLAPQGWGDKKLLSGAWVAGTLALASPPLELGMKVCEDSPEGLVGLGPTATPSPHSHSAPLRPQQPVSCSPEGQEGLGDSWEMAGVPPTYPAYRRWQQGYAPGRSMGQGEPPPQWASEQGCATQHPVTSQGSQTPSQSISTPTNPMASNV